jgi:glycosidase
MADLESKLLKQTDFPYGFHFSQEAWARYDIPSLRHPEGREGAVTTQVYVVRGLSDRMNRARDFGRPGVKPVRTGELLAMGLITDILRYIATIYCAEEHPGAMARGLAWVRERKGDAVESMPLPAFVDHYVPQRIRDGEVPADAYLTRHTGDLSNREIAARECLLLYVNMLNPAMRPYHEIFDDKPLRASTPYEQLVGELGQYFETQPPVPKIDLPLFRALRKPSEEAPDSLESQLEFIRLFWKDLLPPELLERLMVARGILKEETTWRGHGPGPARVLEFGASAGGGYPEYEAFSTDTDWMPNVVLMAKTVYVWLDQLSKKYKRNIYRLDQVPDEELDALGRWGVTGLWLIGLWERSVVSRQMKQMMGNPEAVSSAYSLYDYVIAHDLGGEEAYQSLRARAWKRGIRLASDMVPNHVGIYSRWVVEHPDWFIQLSYPPYPNYRFTGPNLSPDDRVTLQIEDGYWNHSDAAVVFLRRDNHTGDTRYLYHGNDGTSMPWNDTAQLNYLIPEVREAVINTILHVARMFPIIRFDAAMTLAKKHFQRLWFPKGGDEGAVPSRSEHGMSKEDFDTVFPKEFWREVVDRVAKEAPDTLLLAEAFWLMEGYFVRTLGMHRVYNSAFMNMLKMEENAKYRLTVKNVLEFSPQVLQRFVNFMNNPDELTAVEQFGKGDKYFGCAMLLVTLPGLPMLGHGQVEGYAEKYGMEYRRAYWDEQPDQHLVSRHEREIFPLMRRRYLFSGAENFAFFDFVAPEGHVDENVFAYSNRTGDERGLIVYNNAYQATRGHIQLSTAINVGAADSPHLERRSLAGALGITVADNAYYIFRDHRGGLEYLHHSKDLAEAGLHLELHGYQYFAFLDWREVRDNDLSWATLHSILGAQGVPSMEDAYQELILAPILDPFRHAVNGPLLNALCATNRDKAALERFCGYLTEFLQAVAERIGAEPMTSTIVDGFLEELAAMDHLEKALDMAGLDKEAAAFLMAPLQKATREQVTGQAAEAAALRQVEQAHETQLPRQVHEARFWRVPLLWSALRRAGRLADSAQGASTANEAATSAAWMREWFLTKAIARAFQDMDSDHYHALLDASAVKACVAHFSVLPALGKEPWGPLLGALFNDDAVQNYLGMNHWGGRVYLNREQLLRLTHLLLFCYTVAALPIDNAAVRSIEQAYDDLMEIVQTAEDASFDVQAILEALK